MIIFIDTFKEDRARVALKEKDGKLIAERSFKADRTEAEKLLPAILELLKKTKSGLRTVEAIEVENRGGSFTSLRIGVATANALAFALGIPVRPADGGKTLKRAGVEIVKPEYDREPNIGKKQKLKFMKLL